MSVIASTPRLNPSTYGDKSRASRYSRTSCKHSAISSDSPTPFCTKDNQKTRFTFSERAYCARSTLESSTGAPCACCSPSEASKRLPVTKPLLRSLERRALCTTLASSELENYRNFPAAFARPNDSAMACLHGLPPHARLLRMRSPSATVYFLALLRTLLTSASNENTSFSVLENTCFHSNSRKLHALLLPMHDSAYYVFAVSSSSRSSL